jgi:hypothetical protein
MPSATHARTVADRCRKATFYFSAKLLEPMQAPDFIGWVRELMEAFRAYFAREIKPVES